MMHKLYICIFFITHVIFASELPIVHITPPYISPDHMSDDHSCDRPMRRNGFALKAEMRDEKIVVHNYGAGGAGWALSFGLVRESIAQFEQIIKTHPEYKSQSIHIIGAGVMGLLSALFLHEKGYCVKISAKELFDIPSFNAAGMFCPITLDISSTNKDVAHMIGFNSFKEWQLIAKGNHPIFKSGARLMPIFVGNDTDVGLEPYVDCGLIAPAENVMVDFNNGTQHQMRKYTTIFMDTVAMMEEMHRLLKHANITLEQHEVESFSEIKESIIFNCAGLGARALNHDADVMPLRGHLLYLKDQPSAAQMQYMIYTHINLQDENGDTSKQCMYYAPKRSGLLGGTFIKEKKITRNNSQEIKKLLQRSKLFFGVN